MLMIPGPITRGIRKIHWSRFRRDEIRLYRPNGRDHLAVLCDPANPSLLSRTYPHHYPDPLATPITDPRTVPIPDIMDVAR